MAFIVQFEGRNVVDAGSYYSLIRMKGCAKNLCRILPFRTDSRQRRSAILFHNGTPAIVKARGGTFRGRKEWHSFSFFRWGTDDDEKTPRLRREW